MFKREGHKGGHSQAKNIESPLGTIQIDGDTVRVKLNGKERFIAFELNGVNDFFLQSARTRTDAKRWGVSLRPILPTELAVIAQSRTGMFGPEGRTKTSDLSQELARGYLRKESLAIYGVNEEEFGWAEEIAWREILKEISSRAK